MLLSVCVFHFDKKLKKKTPPLSVWLLTQISAPHLGSEYVVFIFLIATDSCLLEKTISGERSSSVFPVSQVLFPLINNNNK